MNSSLSGLAARRGLAAILIASVLWGTVGIATRAIYGLADTNPLSVGFYRLAFATPALLLACWLTLGRQTWRVTRRDLGLMLLIGAAMALYQVCYFAAIERVGVTVAVLVALCTAPVMIALLAALLLGERLTVAALLALVCALGGTTLLVGAPAEGVASGWTMIAGVGLALGAAFGYAVIAICSRVLAGRYHPLQPISIGFAAGAALLLPFTLAAGLTVAYPPLAWALLLHLGLVPTALGYLLFLWGIRHTTATTAGIVSLIEPLVSTLLAWALFGERLGPFGMLGAALLLGAIHLLYRGETRRNAAPELKVEG